MQTAHDPIISRASLEPWPDRPRGRRLLLAALLAGIAATAGCATEVPGQEPPAGDGDALPEEPGELGEDLSDEVGEPEQLPEIVPRPDLSAGMLVTSPGGAGVQVPEPGLIVTATVLNPDGTADQLTIETTEDGRVLEHRVPQLVADEAELVPLAALGACDDRAFNTLSHRWAHRFEWSFNARSVPNRYSASGVADAVKRGVANVTGAHNNCGMSDRVSARHGYLGRTTRRAGLNAAGTHCVTRDDRNVVDFGSMGYALAAACSWAFANASPLDGLAIESDVRFNTNYDWFASAAKPSGCSLRWDVESVATHEFGHVFGLGHVGEKRHGRLTMSRRVPPCDRTQRTLGRGDVRGLNVLY